jgi:hypothetical protein
MMTAKSSTTTTTPSSSEHLIISSLVYKAPARPSKVALSEFIERSELKSGCDDSNTRPTTVQHYENIYEPPDVLGGPIQRAVRETTLAMKSAYGCDSISTRQHNEPAGNQDVWHFHIHVFPRYDGDDLDGEAVLADHSEMHLLAQNLRDAWPT